MSNIVVHHTVEVQCFVNEDGDVWFSRERNKWDSQGRVNILIPRADVPGLIARLQAVLAEGD